MTTPGGTSATSAADQFTYTAAPTVTGLSPTSGPAAGGTSVTITGTGFTGATAVDFGTTAATSVTVVSDTDDHGRQPGGHRHRGRHRDHPGRDVGHLGRRSVHLHRRSDGHGLSPTSGPAAGGTSVTITGTGFTGATAVDFGTTAATSFTVVSDTDDHGRQPGGHRHRGRHRDHPGRHVGHLGRRSVHLHRRADGHGPEPDQRSGGRRHLGDDHRHRLHRRHGGRLRHDGGDERHGGQQTPTITADSPAGTGTVDVTVTTPGGTSATSAADQFTYTAAPTVTGLSPTSGPAAGGTLVTITGTGFTGATAVDFGTTAATSFTVVSDTDDHGRPARRAPAPWTSP